MYYLGACGAGNTLDTCKVKSNYKYGLNLANASGLRIGGPYTFGPVGSNAIQLDPGTGQPKFMNVLIGGCFMGTHSGQNTWILGDGTITTDRSEIMSFIEGAGAGSVNLVPTNSGEVGCLQSGNIPIFPLGDESAYERIPPDDSDDVPSDFGLLVQSAEGGGRTVRIQLDIPMRATGRVMVAIYDVSGRRVSTLWDQDASPGSHWFEWRGGEMGRAAGSGVYFIVLKASEFSTTKKMVWIRE
jgi:hypothetical protein